jgi:hypothetical protein
MHSPRFAMKEWGQHNFSALLLSYRTTPPFLPNPFCHCVKKQVQPAG